MDSNRDLITDRQGLEIMSYEECWLRIRNTPIGRISFVDVGSPMILPVTHRVLGGSVVFQTNPGGKLHAAIMGNRVAFEVDGWDEEARTGWSVVLVGYADTITEPSELEQVEELGLEPWANAINRVNWVRIRADDISGRRILRV